LLKSSLSSRQGWRAQGQIKGEATEILEPTLDEALAMIDNGDIINASILLLHYAERAGRMRGDENQAAAKQPARRALARPQAPPRMPPDRSRNPRLLRRSAPIRLDGFGRRRLYSCRG
jgi:hypothetical protein